MIKERLWTRDFMALVLANGFLFAGFHFLLPTITLYAASLGATGGEIGLIGGIFGYTNIVLLLCCLALIFGGTAVSEFIRKLLNLLAHLLADTFLPRQSL